MSFKSNAFFLAALCGATASQALAQEQTPVQMVDLSTIIDGSGPALSASRVPVPAPRPGAGDAGIGNVSVRRTASGIRLVGPRFFPKQ